MRSLTFIAIVWYGLFSGNLCSAQTFVGYEHMLRDGSPSPTVMAQLEIPGETVNTYGFFMASDAWGEALLGVSKSIQPWLWAAVSSGIETDPSRQVPLRANVTIGTFTGPLTTFFISEYGGADYFYRFTSAARVAPRTSVGILSQRFLGTGPLVQVSLGQGLTVFATLMKGPQSLVGIYKFF